MKVLMINSVCGIRSTGRICTDLALALEEMGHEVRIAYGREQVPDPHSRLAVRIGSERGVKLHGFKARAFDASGFGSRFATARFLNWVREYDPDVIHLHNVHGYYLHVGLLFDYLRTCGKRILWTLHDCWAFTGHAAYCEQANCEKWKTGCSHCPKDWDYPKSLSDHARRNYARKKALFTGIPNLELVTPSQWLADLCAESFLKEYPVTVIHNGINTDIFRPSDGTALRASLGLTGKRVILGVAALWEKRKGLDDFVALSGMLSDRERIVLVGLSERQIQGLPPAILGLPRTNSAQELAALYAMADVYANPTYEDNYPTTNLEAIACGTPVVTYATGGSPESAVLYGASVPKGDLNALLDALRRSYEPSEGAKPSCLDAASALQAYLLLY
ncbi:MAG: glycosyltransferase [Oscillospiraceae bacterium]|nr:glycosyltransferase [Oscillospiraceae bacterium]